MKESFAYGIIGGVLGSLVFIFFQPSSTKIEKVYEDRYIIIRDSDIEGVVAPAHFDPSWRISE